MVVSHMLPKGLSEKLRVDILLREISVLTRNFFSGTYIIC